ncbi:PREDICTED: IQ and AAA domain-containing protein 1 [Elephantulus edwardii]|uniref:IQ and AAA domain-containing protein 1 n=1 Tax=Elephantulus edwardii TaxID=28737 RepID=UPI0003F0D719|nr:PREDICTED: IQ and AAA domain-containing protein 1 [Elephantulus edwardii]
MSNATYNRIWHQTQDSLNSLLDKESQKIEPHQSQVLIFQMLATFYIKYVQIFRKMENVYDQIVHPQKRILIRKMLDGVMGRILELKSEMVELELTEFHYFDDLLQDLKLIPQQLDIPIPRYFLKEKLEMIKGREKILAQILAECGLDAASTRKAVKVMPLDEAIKVIQVAERARQGRLRALFMKQIFLREVRARQNRLMGDKAPDVVGAALCIQKIWRAFYQRKKTKKEREEEMIFLGMNPPPQFDQISTVVLQAQRECSRRDDVQSKHEKDFQEALVSIKDELLLVEGQDIKENLQDQIRHWFIECRNLTGAFPEYPKVEEGGSAIIFSNKTPQEVIANIIESQDEDEKDKKKKEKKQKKPPKDRKGKEEKVIKEQVKEEDEEWKMAPSLFLPGMEEGRSAYEAIWKNKDESWNFHQDYDPEMIKDEKRKELESELRVQVDELMRQELKNLKLVVDREKELPTKGKREGKKKAKEKKGKRREKKDKDLTENRSIESLYKELVEEGLLIQASKVNLSDYIGEYSYLGTTLRQLGIEPMPSLMDVRQLIALYGVLPLGSATVHEKAPLVKSLLLAGPSGVGKKMLVHAICTETGANLFNLSASNIASKYPGRNGLQMMVHIVFKVARQLQPSVLWIGDTEKTFYKRVPLQERKLDPKRLKKQLPKILKLLKPEDRILIVGTTKRPFDAELHSFCKVYQKIILLPRPDYASRYVLWKEIIQQNGGVVTKSLNISCLAKVTDGFTQGHIVQAVKQVLCDQRLKHQTKKPLVAAEFIRSMAGMEPVYQEEEESFKNWYAKTPLGRKRVLALTGSEEEKDKGKQKEKDKGKQKEKDKGKQKAKVKKKK